MTWNDFLRKITSRKLWLSIALFVSGCLTAAGKDKAVAEMVSGLIMQAAAVIGYLVAEGLVDQENAQYYTPKHEEAQDK